MNSLYFSDADTSLHHGECVATRSGLPDDSVHMSFADPPYFLSNGGISCSGGKMVSFDKGNWDKSQGFDNDVAFT